MAADPIINETRRYRRAVESYGREAMLDEAAAPTGAVDAARVTITDHFTSGYDGAETTLPFTADLSIVGGDDVVTM